MGTTTEKDNAIVMVAPNPLNLAQKIVKVRESIGGFSKDAKADKYKYVGGSQVLGKILATMDELHLLLIPTIVPNTLRWERYNYTRKYKSGGEAEVVDYVVEAHMIMTWKDADSNEILEVPWILVGEQEADISKAFGSGLTYTERYFLMKFFNQPTDGDDPDAKKEPKEPEPPTKQELEQAKAEEEAIAIGKAFINEIRFNALSAELSRTRVPVSEMYKNFSITDLNEMTNKDWETAMRILEPMPTRKKKEEVLK